jgi:hypothetical protein
MLIIHLLPHTLSWRIAYLVKRRDNFTLVAVQAAVMPVAVEGAEEERGGEN